MKIRFLVKCGLDDCATFKNEKKVVYLSPQQIASLLLTLSVV